MESPSPSVARFANFPEPLSKSRASHDHYQPPRVTGMVGLFDLLCRAGRKAEPKQRDLLAGPQSSSEKDDVELYFAGDLSLLEKPCVAIVGTRQVSDCGLSRTRKLARGLAEAGIVVVSGLAKGVDTAAHTAAIAAGGQTIAVIGTPLDKVYPAENARLQEEIYRDHLVVTREPQGARTFKSSFPQRNRLMAALTDATVVIEASDTSGTLHQSAECTRLGRWLFIAQSVVDDTSLTWPAKFLKYDSCVPLTQISDVINRVQR